MALTEAVLKDGKLSQIAFMGLRAALGVIFIAHGYSKLTNAGFGGFLTRLGIPPELALLVGLAEFIPGIMLIAGVLSRVSASIISIIMLGAIFHVKGAANLTGEGAYELDLILLASALVIIVLGPGKISIAHLVKKIPKYIH